jgi:hypothetical protein
MSEHRPPGVKPNLIQFPSPDEPDEETAELWDVLEWREIVLPQLMPIARAHRSDLENYNLPIMRLLEIERENFRDLELYWSGLPPLHAEKFVEECAQWWAEYKQLAAENQKLVKEMVRKRIKELKRKLDMV